MVGGSASVKTSHKVKRVVGIYCVKRVIEQESFSILPIRRHSGRIIYPDNILIPRISQDMNHYSQTTVQVTDSGLIMVSAHYWKDVSNLKCRLFHQVILFQTLRFPVSLIQSFRSIFSTQPMSPLCCRHFLL